MATATYQYKNYYYSGGQAEIYMQDVFLDEVTGLSFSTITNKSPLYSYSSVRYDTVARGNLLISGTFEINFVNSNYLNIIASEIAGRGREDPEARSRAFSLRNQAFYPKNLQGPEAAFQRAQALNRLRGLGNVEFAEIIRQIESEGTDRNGASTTFGSFYEIPSFEIFAVFGDSTGSSGNTTVRKILDVHLTGQSQVVDTSGNAVTEQYSFIARDIE